MKIVKGNLISMAGDGLFDVIVHGCNCFNTMGSGIARQVRDIYPEAYDTDCCTEKGDESKLGTCSAVEIKSNGGRSLYIVNAYTQYHYGAGKKHVDYDAVRRCFNWIMENYPGMRIGFPRIGAGLGGGDWHIISRIIEEELAGSDFTLVEYVSEER